ncbi:MAG: FdtA/QdtA family cupin domain-containing protein, partial [Actinomycetes bacterium]
MKDQAEVLVVKPPVEAHGSVTFGRCTLTRLPAFADSRGLLAVVERHSGLPFDVKRCFMVFGVPEGQHRGGHSLKDSHEVMICVSGSITVDVDDGETCWRVVLDDPTISVYVPTGVWSEQHSFSSDAVMIVLASNVYDANEFDSVRPTRNSD